MSLYASEPERKELPLVTAGSHCAVCCSLIDIGKQTFKDNKSGKTRVIPKVMIEWELDETIEIDGEEQPRIIRKTYTNSLSDKATLFKDLKSWRGRAFTYDELKRFDLRNIIGANCLLSIGHNTSSEGKTYANIDAIAAPMKGMIPLEPTKVTIFDLDSPTALTELEQLPDWILDRIKESVTYKEMTAEPLPFDDSDTPFPE